MQANTISANKKIPQFDYATLAGTQPLPPAAPCVCGSAHHSASTMAPAASALQEKQPESAASSRTPSIETFCWYLGGAQTPEQEVIGQAHDVASGLVEILNLLEQDDIGSACGEQRMFSPFRRGNLMRMAITSARMLMEECAENINYVNEKRRAE